MNSLTLGFFYVVGMAWTLSECCVQASAGNSLPLILFAIGFTVIFAIMGCLDVSDKVIDMAGLVTASIMGLALLGFSFASWKSSGTMVGLPKVLLAMAFLAGSFAGILSAPSSTEEAEAGEH